MEYTKIEKESYNLHYIYSDKFKRNRILIKFKELVNKEKITYRNLLTLVLMESTKEFKTRRLLDIECENLYNINVGAYTDIVGNYNTLLFKTDFLNETCTESNNDLKSLNFFLSFIFNPDIKDNAFYGQSLSNSIDILRRNILSYNDNPHNKASSRFDELIAKDTPVALKGVGYLEDLDNVTGTRLYDYYKEVLKNDLVDIFVFGNIDIKLIENELDKHFINVPNETHISPIINYVNNGEPLLEVKEIKESNQSILFMGSKINNISDFERWYVLPIYNYVLGGNPSSILFNEVREKNSLCYYIDSYFRGVSSIEVITSSIDAKNYNKVKELVLKEIENMKNGKFPEKLIEEAKIAIKLGLNEMTDFPSSIINMYDMHDFLGMDLKEERLKKTDSVTKEDIIKIANKINIDTIYLLEGSKRNEETD